MNNLYENLKHDTLEHDPAMTRDIVEQWAAGRQRRRRWRNVLATIGPLTAAAVLVLSVVLIRTTAQQEQRREAARAVASLMRSANLSAALQTDRIEDTVDRTSDWLDADRALAMVVPTTSTEFNFSFPDTSQWFTQDPELAP